MTLTEQDIENGRIYCGAMTGGYLPIGMTFNEASRLFARVMKSEYGEHWFNHEAVQRAISPSITFTVDECNALRK